jgi:hypothetical protein
MGGRMEIDTVAIGDRGAHPATIHRPQTLATRARGAVTGVSG